MSIENCQVYVATLLNRLIILTGLIDMTIKIKLRMQTKVLITIFALLFTCSTVFAQSWTMLPTTGSITARSNASAIYIPSSNRMIVFGGNTSGGNVNEIWSLDLNSNVWSLIPPTSAQAPAPRATHVCMYDSLLNRMLVWTGQGSQLYNDVWAFNFGDSTWLELFPDGNVTGAPLKRYGTATVFDPINRNIINFAGFTTSGRFDDTWEFDVDGLNWTDKTNLYFPLRRCLTSQSFAEDRREMIVYGGQSTGNLNDIWTLNADTYIWTNLTPAVSPAARHFSSNSYCGNGYVVVFGGNSLNQGNTAGALNDLWAFSLDTQQWDTLPQGAVKPPPRYGHTSIYIQSQDKMIIFGGQGASSLYNETWVYSGISGVLNFVSEYADNISLLKVYPNPSADSRSISFYLPEKSKAYLTIQNILGSVVATPLNNNELNYGNHTIDISDHLLAPGTYLCSLKTAGVTESILLVVIE